MATGPVTIKRLDSADHSEADQWVDPTLFFDERSHDAQWQKVPPSHESTSDGSQVELLIVNVSKDRQPAEREQTPKHTSDPSEDGEQSPRDGTPEYTTPRLDPQSFVQSSPTGIWPRVVSSISPMTESSASGADTVADCAVTRWAQNYWCSVSAFLERARASTSLGEQFNFIFAIPLLKISGERNCQWRECALVSDGQTRFALELLMVDPYTHDTVYVAKLPKSLQGKSFRLESLDPTPGEADGPYVMPETRDCFVSLRDGRVGEGHNVLNCGIEIDVSAVPDRDTKRLAFWNEVSNQWVSVPLSATVAKILIHQKRCLANIYDVHRGRLTEDRLIPEPGVVSLSC